MGFYQAIKSLERRLYKLGCAPTSHDRLHWSERSGGWSIHLDGTDIANLPDSDLVEIVNSGQLSTLVDKALRSLATETNIRRAIATIQKLAPIL